MGGLGKSTLAKKVYHHDDVRRRFSCFAWVCVSQQFQVRTIWEEILVKLLSADDGKRQEIDRQRQEIARMSNDAVAKKIYQIQKDKRCLVVIDDIWTTEAWDSLKAAFPNDREKSKIVLTTRIKVVAEHADSRGFLYQPLPLTKNESWELFETIALLPRKGELGLEMYRKLEELAKKMLERCEGLSLAINVLAGLLAKKNTVHEWDAVHKNVDANIMRGVGQGKEYAGVSWMLELSYDDLPYHLKPCFLYLGLFPEDYEISASELTKQWTAEGFISSSNINSMDDSAYDYLHQLVERCMVQVGKPDLQIRKIKTCRMHDLMREMCLLMTEEENFLQIANFSNRYNSVGKVRRLAIHLKEDNEKLVPSRDQRDYHMRTLLYFGPNNNWMPKQVKSLRSMLQDFQLLRILKLNGITLREKGYLKLPDAIGSMVHLRFLSLRRSYIRRVPSSIGNLINLQTLDLRFDELKNELLPNLFWKMEELRHLYFPPLFTSIGKLKLSTLHNLQTLSGITSDSCNFGDLAELKNLTKLVVIFDNEETFSTDLGQLLQCTSRNCIRSLTVRDYIRSDNTATVVQIISSCRDLCALDLNGVKIKELATGLQSYHNLTKLTVANSDLKNDQMAMLEQLPNLITLTLDEGFKSDTETPNSETLLCSKGGFRRLQYLYLHDSNLKKWTVSEGAMPSLCRLAIYDCSSLKEISIGLRYVTALKVLIIYDMPRRFCSRLEQGGDDFCIIQHVPFVVIRDVREDEDET